MTKKYILLSILLLLLTTCGGYDHEGTSGTGNIAFKIDWQNAPNSSKVSLQGEGEAISKNSTDQGFSPSYAPLDCTASGVSTVIAVVYSTIGSHLATGGPWNCSDGSGNIEKVPAGTNRKVVVLGKDSSDNILYGGEQTGITVVDGQTNYPVTITATSFVPTGVSASAGNGQITISWNSVAGATFYAIHWSTTSGVTKISSAKIYIYGGVLSYTHTGLTNGTTYYYVVTAVNDYAENESSESSQVSATPTSSTTGTAWSMLKLPDTGQTGDYTTTIGEDADYTINPPSYTDNGNGTITDNVTGLIWQKEDDNTTRSWADAGTYCDSLILAGYSDWRLPSKKELISILNYGTYNPSINTTYFTNTNWLYYWTSTTDANYTSDVWIVSFGNGYVDGYGKLLNFYVRCVRGEGQATTKSFADNGNGTVTDNNTKLMWQKEDDNTERQWESAITYCEGLSLGGYTDWRLPNIKELESITEDTKYNPSIDTTYFPNTNSSAYWASTTVAYDTSIAWFVGFYDGNISDGSVTGGKSYGDYVRCVRGGQ